MSIGQGTRNKGHHVRQVLLVGALVAVVGAGVAWGGYRALPGGFAHHRYGGGLMRLHAEFVVDRALEQAEATEAQRRQIEAITARLFDERAAMRTERAKARQEIAALLQAEKVDRGQLEALRARQLERIDAASRRLTEAAADIADVLTPAQRGKLLEWVHELHSES